MYEEMFLAIVNVLVLLICWFTSNWYCGYKDQI